MKKLQKINKGVLLTIIVLIILLSYLIQVEAMRNAQKEEILASCKEYISIIDQYSVKTEKEVEEAKNKLKEIMIDKEVATNLQMKQLREVVKKATQGELKVTSIKREIKNVKSYEFDAEQVKVTLYCKIIKETTNLEGNKDSQTNYNTYEITLKKEQNRWKVVYSDLQEQDLLNEAATTMQVIEGVDEF